MKAYTPSVGLACMILIKIKVKKMFFLNIFVNTKFCKYIFNELRVIT
jgi:hypothetical protein